MIKKQLGNINESNANKWVFFFRRLQRLNFITFMFLTILKAWLEAISDFLKFTLCNSSDSMSVNNVQYSGHFSKSENESNIIIIIISNYCQLFYLELETFAAVSLDYEMNGCIAKLMRLESTLCISFKFRSIIWCLIFQ